MWEGVTSRYILNDFIGLWIIVVLEDIKLVIYEKSEELTISGDIESGLSNLYLWILFLELIVVGKSFLKIT